MIQDFIALIREALQNDVLMGGMALGLLYTLLAYAKYLPRFLKTRLERIFTITAEIRDGSNAFTAMDHWLSTIKYAKTCKRLSVNDKDGRGDTPQLGVSQPQNSLVSLAPGLHFFRASGVWCLLHRERSDAKHQYKGYKETFHFTFFTKNKKKVFKILNEADQLFRETTQDLIPIYAAIGMHWEACTGARKRPLDSVILAEGLTSKILTIIDRFIDSEDFYVEKGFPYRLGLLFSGPPGSGKTSLVKGLSTHYEMPVYLLTLSSALLTDDGLLDLLLELPKKCVVLLEDVDCVSPTRESDKEKKGVSMAGLLNAIDGVASPEGRILVMTTNYPEKLDPALIRKGRIDHHFKLEAPTQEQLRRYMGEYYPKEGEPLPTSMADAQVMILDKRKSEFN